MQTLSAPAAWCPVCAAEPASPADPTTARPPMILSSSPLPRLGVPQPLVNPSRFHVAAERCAIDVPPAVKHRRNPKSFGPRVARWLATPANMLTGQGHSAFQLCVTTRGPRGGDARTASSQWAPVTGGPVFHARPRPATRWRSFVNTCLPSSGASSKRAAAWQPAELRDRRAVGLRHVRRLSPRLRRGPRRHCAEELRVPFSCKGRGVCRSCIGRRMAEGAALMVDHRLPAVPCRQWVLSFEGPMAVRLGYDTDVLRRVCRRLAHRIVELEVSGTIVGRTGQHTPARTGRNIEHHELLRIAHDDEVVADERDAVVDSMRSRGRGTALRRPSPRISNVLSSSFSRTMRPPWIARGMANGAC